VQVASISAAWGGVKKEVDRTATMRIDVVNDPHLEHVGNFLDRKRAISDIQTGQRSNTTCHLGNVAYRSREPTAWKVANQRSALSSGMPGEMLSTQEGWGCALRC